MTSEPKRSSAAGSTHSGAVAAEVVREPSVKTMKSPISTYLYGGSGKSTRFLDGYTSIFPRKLIPPLGFYREVDKYCKLKAKFVNDLDKLDALEMMWKDYRRFQIRERFKWPPTLFFKKFFWSTGYYPDYQKTTRATKVKKEEDISSDNEETPTSIGRVFTVAAGKDDINVKEFQQYQEAKRKQKNGKKSAANGIESAADDPRKQLETKATISRLFGGELERSEGNGADKAVEAEKVVK